MVLLSCQNQSMVKNFGCDIVNDWKKFQFTNFNAAISNCDNALPNLQNAEICRKMHTAAGTCMKITISARQKLRKIAIIF